MEIKVKTYETEILRSQLAKLEASIETVNKSLIKYFLSPVIILSKTDSTYRDIESHKDIASVKIVLSHPELLHNGRKVTYVGTITLVDGQKKIHNVNDAFVLGALDTKTLTCDHCHKALPRTRWSFFEEDGKLIHIGSTCAKEYFGVSVERLLDFWDILGHLEEKDEEGFGYGGHVTPYASFRELVGAIILATHNFEAKYVSKANSDDIHPNTGNLVLGWLFPNYRSMDPAEIADHKAKVFDAKVAADKIIVELSTLLKVFHEPKNDFEYNVFNALFEATENGPRLVDFIMFFGPAVYAIYKVWVDAHKVAEISDAKNEHFGKTGERLVLTGLKVLTSVYRDSDFGTTHIIGFEDPEGRRFKSFYSGYDEYKLGEVYNIKGTIKNHTEYKGHRETLLSRIALYVEKAPKAKKVK